MWLRVGKFMPNVLKSPFKKCVVFLYSWGWLSIYRTEWLLVVTRSQQE